MSEREEGKDRVLSLGLVRVPVLHDHLVRVEDGKRFRVEAVVRLGGDVRLTLRSPDGERASVGMDELFPPLHVPQPFHPDRRGG